MADSIRLVIDPDIYDLIPGYLQTRRGELPVFSQLLEAADFGEISRMAHKIKGTGGGYGFAEITRIGAALEAAAKAGNAAECKSLVAELTDYLSRVEPVSG